MWSIGQPVPGRGRGEVVAERQRCTFLEDPWLPTPDVHGFELPQPTGRGFPFDRHRFSLRAASDNAVIAQPIASVASLASRPA